MVPLSHRVKILMPRTREEIIIELCSNDSPDFLAGGIEDHLNLMLPQASFKRRNSAQVVKKNDTSVLTLKLPEQSHSRALTLAPDLPEPSIRHYGEQSQS